MGRDFAAVVEDAPPASLWTSLRKGPLKVSIIGSGNWGSAVAKIVGENCARSHIFDSNVRMWVFEEKVNGRNLTEIINADHENVKYLPGIKLPSNLVAVPDVLGATMDADLLIFVLPHQFIMRICEQLKGKVKASAKAISLVKGFKIEQGTPRLFSDVINEILGIDCCMLSGANVANGVARGEFSETTIGYNDKETAAIWQQLFDTPTFRVNGVPDCKGVEVCGAIKNVIALAAGFCDGMGLGTNSKAAIIRIGVEEMKQFANIFFAGIVEETFFDSAGYADTITTCFGGRNVRCAAEFVKRRQQGKANDKQLWQDVERELLNGQKLQGTLTCAEVHEVISHFRLQRLFPLFTATYRVAFEGAPTQHIIEVFKNDHPRPMKLREECSSCAVTPQVAAVKRMLAELASSSTPRARL